MMLLFMEDVFSILMVNYFLAVPMIAVLFICNFFVLSEQN